MPIFAVLRSYWLRVTGSATITCLLHTSKKNVWRFHAKQISKASVLLFFVTSIYYVVVISICCFVGSLGISVDCLLCAANSFFSTMINFAAAVAFHAMSSAMHFIHVIYQFNLYVILIPILMGNILVAYSKKPALCIVAKSAFV